MRRANIQKPTQTTHQYPTNQNSEETHQEFLRTTTLKSNIPLFTCTPRYKTTSITYNLEKIRQNVKSDKHLYETKPSNKRKHFETILETTSCYKRKKYVKKNKNLIIMTEDFEMVPDSAESSSAQSTGTTPLFTSMTITKPPLKIKLPNPYFGQTEYIKASSPPHYFKSSKDKGKGRDPTYSSAHIPPTDNDLNNKQRYQNPGPSRTRSQSPPKIYDRRNDHERFPPRRERIATAIIKNDEYATRADRTLKQFKAILPPFLNHHTATTILKDKFRNLANLKIIIKSYTNEFDALNIEYLANTCYIQFNSQRAPPTLLKVTFRPKELSTIKCNFHEATFYETSQDTRKRILRHIMSKRI